MSELKRALLGWHMTLAEIHYHLPDFPNLLQQFIWQEPDRVPRLPRLNQFLTFWQKNLDGRIHSVRVAVRGLISPTDLKLIDGEFRLN